MTVSGVLRCTSSPDAHAAVHRDTKERVSPRSLTKDESLACLAARVANWWMPDNVIFVEALPVGGTGKVQKAKLRKQYGGVFS